MFKNIKINKLENVIEFNANIINNKEINAIRVRIVQGEIKILTVFYNSGTYRNFDKFKIPQKYNEYIKQVLSSIKKTNRN